MIRLKHFTYIATIIFIVLSFRLAATNPPSLMINDGKAHYIIEAIKHITWPNENDITRFNIVILGHDRKLMRAIKSKANIVIRGKSIAVQQFNDLADIHTSPEVILVTQHNLSLIADIIKQHSNTLVISDSATKRQTIMVGLLVSKNDIKLTINREYLVAKGYKISSSLLDFAGTKADLRKELKDRETTLNKVLQAAQAKEQELINLNFSLAKNKDKLQKIQTDLVKQNNLLFEAQSELASLKSNKKAIQLELTNKKNNLLAQQALIAQQEVEHQEQQQKLHQLKVDIAENEAKLQQRINQLKQQNTIIERKEEKISGQRKLLYITVALVFIILLLKFVILRISNRRKEANKKLANLNEQLYELATKDDMTKLFNRRHFLELSQRELSQLARTKSQGVVLMLDIDQFKNVNDSHGHAAGDQAIINVANILKDNLREYDIVGRVGGEEFTMFLPNSEIDIAIQIAERIRIKVANLSIVLQQATIKLTISIGLTAKKEDETSINDMLQRADKALYQAKNSGRNKVVLL